MKLAIIAGDELFLIDLPEDLDGGLELENWIEEQLKELELSPNGCQWGVISYINGGSI